MACSSSYSGDTNDWAQELGVSLINRARASLKQTIKVAKQYGGKKRGNQGKKNLSSNFGFSSY